MTLSGSKPGKIKMGKTSPEKIIEPQLLDLLVCPLTKGPLELDHDAQELISRKAKLAYPIRDCIPIMLVSEARALDE